MMEFNGPKYQLGIINLASASVIAAQRTKAQTVVDGGVFNVDETLVSLSVGATSNNFDLTNNTQGF